jgi:preprotein translocase subunit SecE
MSRLQKKKPASEKKKKAEPNNAVTSEGTVSTARRVSVPPTPKAKPENKNPGTTKDKGAESITRVFQNAAEFLREVKVELKKVTWPTRKQTTGTTIVVIIFVFIIAVLLGLFDLSLSKLVQMVLT